MLNRTQLLGIFRTLNYCDIVLQEELVYISKRKLLATLVVILATGNFMLYGCFPKGVSHINGIHETIRSFLICVLKMSSKQSITKSNI